MKLEDITRKCYILALIIRDDGERLLLGDGFYEFKESHQNFIANTYVNDVVELQGTDGQLLAGQIRRSAAQPFDGYIGDASANRQEIEEHRKNFFLFFRKNHYYKAVYIFPDGTAIQRKRGYITDAPSSPELYEDAPEYHIALNFEDPNYYEYAEDTDGEEIFANIVDIAITATAAGGLVWTTTGANATTTGYEWESGEGGGPATLTIDGVDEAHPTWTIVGPATNPSITNITTAQTLTWTGIVPEGQTLTINTDEQTADLAGANVFENISGDWLDLVPGNNSLSYTAQGTEAPSTLSWNGVAA